MSYDDFCRLDIREFAAVYKAYVTQRDFDFKEEWERTRMTVAVLVQTHSTRRLTVQEILPLPWDEKEQTAAELTPEERERRTEELMERVNNYERKHD